MFLRTVFLILAFSLLPPQAHAGRRDPVRRPAVEQQERERTLRKPVRRAEQAPREERATERQRPPRPRPANAPRTIVPERELPNRPQAQPRSPANAQPPLSEPPTGYPDLIPVIDPVPVLERRYVSISSVTGICELSIEDEYLSWQLADVTGRPYFEIASTRAEGWSWPTVLRELQIEEGEMLLALHFPAEDDMLVRDWNDEEIAAFVNILIGDEVVPDVECEDGFWVNPMDPLARYGFDTRDREIARRIAAQTGFDASELLLAHREFGHWGQVGRVFSMTPYAFEVMFDVELPAAWHAGVRHLDFPDNRALRDSVAEAEQQPMSWAPEPLEQHGALKTGLKWATFFGILGLVGGMTG